MGFLFLPCSEKTPWKQNILEPSAQNQYWSSALGFFSDKQTYCDRWKGVVIQPLLCCLSALQRSKLLPEMPIWGTQQSASLQCLTFPLPHWKHRKAATCPPLKATHKVNYCSSVLHQVYPFNTGNGKQQIFCFCCLNIFSNVEKSTHHLFYSCLHEMI